MKGIFGIGSVISYIFAIIFDNVGLASLGFAMIYIEINT